MTSDHGPVRDESGLTMAATAAPGAQGGQEGGPRLESLLLPLLSPDAEGRVSLHDVLAGLALLARVPGSPAHLVDSGRLLRRAWEALRAETDDLRARAAGTRDAAPEATGAPEDPWNAFLASEWAQEVVGQVDVGEHLLRATEPVLVPPVWRPPPAGRWVTLPELVEALREAEAEARVRLARDQEAGERRARARERRQAAMASQHEDDVARDRERVWTRLVALGGQAGLRDLAADQTPAGLVAALQGVLALVRAGRSYVSQPQFPYGPIIVTAILSRAP